MPMKSSLDRAPGRARFDPIPWIAFVLAVALSKPIWTVSYGTAIGIVITYALSDPAAAVDLLAGCFLVLAIWVMVQVLRGRRVSLKACVNSVVIGVLGSATLDFQLVLVWG